MAEHDPMGRPLHSVLVIDDDQILLDLLELTLRDLGYSVTVASSGEAGLRAAASHHFDVIILDSIMPGMDGPQVLRELKSVPRTAGIPVIMLTANTNRDSVTQAIGLGAYDYIAKPLDLPRLADRLQKLFDRAPPKADAQSRMELNAPARDFDLPLSRKNTRVFLNATDQNKKPD
jgi:CheY-like chemotaxis protein